ncbi:MAG: cyclic nucleotide-binding domain-containing protein [Bacteroidia bacterium]
MNKPKTIANQKEIVSKYFSNGAKKIELNKGDVLLEQRQNNNRLFYISSGRLNGYLPDKDPGEPIFEAQQGSFVGVYSFIAEEHLSYSKVVAFEPTVVYYFDGDAKNLEASGAKDFQDFLFNMAVAELKQRQGFAAQMAQKHNEVLNKLIKTEKLITLGQLSAGLAHELNNAIGSINANLRNLEQDLKALLLQNYSEKINGFLNLGIEKGQVLSSSEERTERKKWPKHLDIGTSNTRKLIRAGIKSSTLKNKEEASEAASLWNLGNTLHDMKIATTQASHVINSIKSMGVANQNWSKDVDLNKTLFESISILKSLARRVYVKLDISDTILVEACHGELVQVWVNLLKNAIESLINHPVEEPTVSISTHDLGENVRVEISDNGKGISSEIITRIFEPNFTTKVSGISLGLGVGLTIVQRIIAEHDGELVVTSDSGKTTFSITLKKELQKEIS